MLKCADLTNWTYFGLIANVLLDEKSKKMFLHNSDMFTLLGAVVESQNKVVPSFR